MPCEFPFCRCRWISSGTVIGYPVPMLCITCQNVSHMFEHSSACPQPNGLTGSLSDSESWRTFSQPLTWSSNACFLTEVDRFRNGALFSSPAWDRNPSCSEPSLRALLGQRHGRPLVVAVQLTLPGSIQEALCTALFQLRWPHSPVIS